MLKLKKILLILTIALVFVGMMFLIPGILYAVPSVSPASATIEVGVDIAINPIKENFREKALGFSNSGFDLIELTITNKITLNQSIDLVRDGGCIEVFAGPTSKKDIEVDFESLYKRELTILSSYSATPESLERGFNYIKEEKVDFSPLISSILPIEKFKEGLELALSQKKLQNFILF